MAEIRLSTLAARAIIQYGNPASTAEAVKHGRSFGNKITDFLGITAHKSDIENQCKKLWEGKDPNNLEDTIKVVVQLRTHYVSGGGDAKQFDRAVELKVTSGLLGDSIISSITANGGETVTIGKHNFKKGELDRAGYFKTLDGTTYRINSKVANVIETIGKDIEDITLELLEQRYTTADKYKKLGDSYKTLGDGCVNGSADQIGSYILANECCKLASDKRVNRDQVFQVILNYRRERADDIDRDTTFNELCAAITIPMIKGVINGELFEQLKIPLEEKIRERTEICKFAKMTPQEQQIIQPAVESKLIGCGNVGQAYNHDGTVYKIFREGYIPSIAKVRSADPVHLSDMTSAAKEAERYNLANDVLIRQGKLQPATYYNLPDGRGVLVTQYIPNNVASADDEQLVINYLTQLEESTGRKLMGPKANVNIRILICDNIRYPVMIDPGFFVNMKKDYYSISSEYQKFHMGW